MGRWGRELCSRSASVPIGDEEREQLKRGVGGLHRECPCG
jgi:hypothetical protein